MTPQPHPLRCETCDHYNGGEYFDKCKNEIFPDNMDSTERQYIKDWISSHGCASHSAASRPAPSAPAPNQHVCLHLEYRNDVGFCHYHDNPIQLNTMPEGTTCEECQRFRKPECPYPGSNITMNKCKAFLINLQQHDASIRNQTLDESDKEWKSFEDWLINTPFPQDSQKIVAKILKKTCSIRESLRNTEVQE